MTLMYARFLCNTFVIVLRVLMTIFDHNVIRNSLCGRHYLCKCRCVMIILDQSLPQITLSATFLYTLTPFYNFTAVWFHPSGSLDVHPFRNIRRYVPSWPLPWCGTIPRPNPGPQPGTRPFSWLGSQHDGPRFRSRDTKCTTWHAWPSTGWLLSG